MSKTARVPEPSMEEILASIRRIIADDGNAAAPAGAAAGAATPERVQGDADASMATNPAEEPQAEPDVLELTEPVDLGAAASFTPIRGPDVVFRDEERRPQAVEQPALHSVTPASPPARAQNPAPPSAPSPVRRSADERLLSPTSTAAVSAAFNSLASTVLSEHSRTLEDIVKEMMRPMLKDWLEENLPSLVERIVRAEIERVARGGR